MSAVINYENDTLPLSQTNVILPLISLMATHFLVNSFTLISDLETDSVKEFQKMASKYFLEMSHRNSVPANTTKLNDNEGFLILEKPEAEISKMMNTKAKVMVAIYNVEENNFEPPKFLSKIIFPLSIPFFVVLLSENSKLIYSSDTSHGVQAKCFRLYKPIPTVPLKMFLTMSYGGEETPKWFWETKTMDWNFFWRETLNMTGITLTIALASPLDEKLSISRYWKSKNSFYWRQMETHLWFRPKIHFQAVTSQSARSTGSVYFSLLNTVADGLAVLPVISPERDRHLEFILTGCDSKHHLMVKTPEYVHSWQSIFKPLALDSWICMGIIIWLISLTLRLVTYNQKSHIFSLSGCCLMVLGFVCSQGSTHIPNSSSVRLVCYTALLFSIIMYQFYTSNFYSLLSTKEVKLPFTSLQQFMMKKTHKMYINPETALYAYIANSKSGIVKQLYDEFLKKDPTHRLTTFTRMKALENVCKGKGVIFGLPFQTIYFRELNCKLVPVSSGYFPTNVVNIVRKNFPFKSQFQFVHWRLLESGISHKFRDEFLNFESQHEIKKTVTNEPVSLEHVAFLLGFLTAFLILSFLILLIEISVSKAIKTKK